jgi:hypothetical protein
MIDQLFGTAHSLLYVLPSHSLVPWYLVLYNCSTSWDQGPATHFTLGGSFTQRCTQKAADLESAASARSQRDALSLVVGRTPVLCFHSGTYPRGFLTGIQNTMIQCIQCTSKPLERAEQEPASERNLHVPT